MILNWKEGTYRVRFEIGNGHLATGKKCRDPSEPSNRDQYPSTNLYNTCDDGFWIAKLRRATKHAQ